MAVYVVTWNLNREVADPNLETVRWISTNLSAGALCADLKLKIDANDAIFVAQLATGSYSGFMRPATSAWIAQRL
jgi:hypothetical protein